ncbi:copper resistance D family protein [Gordonia sp. DT218]|uniref:copper resistance D family protein n=1 Tax=Gordonia sp. DT218 TaxID=3416659 RepID=UPI003CEF7043
MGIAGRRTPESRSWMRDLALPGALLAMFSGLGLCWILAAPAGPEAAAVPSTAAVGAAVLLVGLGALPGLGLHPSIRVIGVAGGVWCVAALVSAWMRTADQAGESSLAVSVGQFADTLGEGAPEVVELIAAVLVVALASVQLTGRMDPPVAAYAVLGAIGLLAAAITGHPSQTAVGPVLIGAHALAAAWWCGCLAAMLVTIRGRAGWTTALPVFSRRAVWAVAIIAATGAVTGLMEVGGLGELVAAGYGRILLAKLAGTAALVVLGARHRRRWVPAVIRHRSSETTSIRLAMGELLVMAVVLGLAVGLSTTAP